jgi:hypothetical protein
MMLSDNKLKKKLNTKIKVGNEYWEVPRGFGKWYLRVAEDPAPHDVLSDILSLVGYAAHPDAIEKWSLRKRVELQVYAANMHLIASDNIMQRHPPIDYLPGAWLGPERGEGVWAGPGGTPLD